MGLLGSDPVKRLESLVFGNFDPSWREQAKPLIVGPIERLIPRKLRWQKQKMVEFKARAAIYFGGVASPTWHPADAFL
jgi:hypothetical protein